MQQITLQRSPKTFMAGLGVPGCWTLWKGPEGTFVLVCCPQCRRIITITKDHKISEDGTVTPSCICPVGYCQYHAHVKLEGWDTKEVEYAKAK